MSFVSASLFALTFSLSVSAIGMESFNRRVLEETS